MALQGPQKHTRRHVFGRVAGAGVVGMVVLGSDGVEVDVDADCVPRTLGSLSNHFFLSKKFVCNIIILEKISQYKTM